MSEQIEIQAWALVTFVAFAWYVGFLMGYLMRRSLQHDVKRISDSLEGRENG